jgi:peptidoglycan/xylan/chitin deacetylase (PgdA/CDA1 family)
MHLIPRWLKPVLSPTVSLRLMPDSLICPVYHTTWQQPPVWWNQRYRARNLTELQADLEYLLRLAPPVSLQDLLEWRQGRRERPRGWFLSFDDGYRQMAQEIAPLLVRMGVPATFFVCSSLVDNRTIFFEDLAGLIAERLQAASLVPAATCEQICAAANTTVVAVLQARVPDFGLLNRMAELLELDVSNWLRGTQPYLTGCDIQRLLADGFSIGAHSVDHSLFCGISPQEAIRQTVESVDQLVSQFDLPYRVFAFPYGEFQLSRDLLRTLQSAANVQMMFGTRGVIYDELEPWLVQRMLAEEPAGDLRHCLKQQLNLQLQRRWSGRNLVKRTG